MKKLRLFRRHRESCRKRSEAITNSCDCPVFASGWAGDEYKKKIAVGTTDWEEAERWRHERRKAGTFKIEAQPPLATPQITIEYTISSFIADCQSRKLNPATLRKYKLLQKQLLNFCEQHRIVEVKNLTPAAVCDFRASWKLGPRSAAKQLDRLKSYCRYLVDNDWLTKSPAVALKPPKAKIAPREPFSDTEQSKILLWCNRPVWVKPEGKKGVLPPHPKTATFLKLLFFTALRITDAATLTKDRIDNGRLLLYTQKNGKPVWLPLPPDLLRELDEIPSPQLFASPEISQRPETISDYWRDQVAKVFEHLKIAGNPTPHRFRHSLAVNMLNNGSTLEDVALVLGNSPAIVAEHYATFSKTRQERINSEIVKMWRKPVKLVLVK